MKDHTLRIRVLDKTGATYDRPVFVELKHRTLATAAGIRRDFLSGSQIDVQGLVRCPHGTYQLTVSGKDCWEPVSQFVTIPACGFITVEVKLLRECPGRLLAPLDLPGGRRIPLGRTYSTAAEWEQVLKANDGIPQAENMAGLARRLFPIAGTENATTRGALRNLDECAEGLLSNFLLGLRNPELTASQEGQIRDTVSNHSTFFETTDLGGGRIHVHWFDGPPQPEWLTDFDLLLQRLIDRFGEPWRARSGGGNGSPAPLVEIEIKDMLRIRGMTCLDGPITLNRRYLADPGAYYNHALPPGGPENLRKALFVHELFHRIQYAYGFRRAPEIPALPYQWFSEGTASWAEYAFTGVVTSEAKGRGFFRVSEGGLFGASYFTLPFWQDLDRDGELGRDPIRRLLDLYGAIGPKAALREVVESSQPLEDYIVRWAFNAADPNTPPIRPNPVGIPEKAIVSFSSSNRKGFAPEFSILQFDPEPEEGVRPTDSVRVSAFKKYSVTGVPRAAFLAIEPTPFIAGHLVNDTFGSLLLSPPDQSIQVDALGNVIIRRPRLHGVETTVLGYATDKNVVMGDRGEGEFSLNWQPWETDQVAPTPGTGIGALSSQTVEQGSNSSMVRVVVRHNLGTIERIVSIVDGNRLQIQTKLSSHEFSIIQRTAPYGVTLSDQDDGGNGQNCGVGECDPICGATMNLDPVLPEGLQMGTPWTPGPGWVVMPIVRVGAGPTTPYTIKERYDLRGS